MSTSTNCTLIRTHDVIRRYMYVCMTYTYIDETCNAAARIFTVTTMTDPIVGGGTSDAVYVTLSDVDGNACETAQLVNGQDVLWRDT